ncbi:4-oxalocrotonate decarboxylase, partial [Micromonospora sp. NPDC007220]
MIGPDTAGIAERLGEAADTATAIPQLAAETGLDVDAAYGVQTALIQRRLDRGERLIGLKMGLTSKAKMAQVGVDEVIWGRLTDTMRI